MDKFVKIVYLIVLIFVDINYSLANIKWYNPLEDSKLPIQGRYWNKEIGTNYHRIPKRMKNKLRNDVWRLSNHSAGLYIKFITNANTISVKYQVAGNLSMPHMPSTGVSGLDLYTVDSSGNQFWCAGLYQFGDTIKYDYKDIININEGKGNEYTLYLPLYNEVKMLEIGVPEESFFEFVSPSNEKPIVVYGTSITQGACASRPGMAWTNILNRKLNTPVVNLGFSGNGQLDKELFVLLSEIHASLFIIDCMPNMTDDRVKLIKPRMMEGLKIIREKTNTPILIVEHDGYMGYHVSETRKEWFMKTNRELKDVYNIMKYRIDNLYYLSFEELALSMDSQVDGVHATDLGMIEYAEAYYKKILSLSCVK